MCLITIEELLRVHGMMAQGGNPCVPLLYQYPSFLTFMLCLTDGGGHRRESMKSKKLT